VLVEQSSADPLERAIARASGEDIGEVQLRDVLRAIDAAAKDDRIERMLLRPDRLLGGGIASLREVAEALRRFKASGKEIVAFAVGMDQRQYLLAAEANEIWLDPEGAVVMEGLGRYRPYYREALADKLLVDVHLFKVGEYKSAAEPFILDGPSAEAQEADLHWMQDVWQRHLAEIASARGLKAEDLQAGIENIAALLIKADGRLSQMALDQGLVDELKTEAEMRAELIARGVEDEDLHSFRQVNLDSYLGFLGPQQTPFDQRPAVAIVVAQGPISGGSKPQGEVGGDSTSALLRKAREDENVKSVVLRVDSPGGEVFASEQIRREVVLLKAAGKPVVVSMANLAASGGYWISMNADRIYASPSTITGSIGIFGLIPTFPRTLEMVGVRMGGVGTTKLAGAFDPRRPLSPELGSLIQSVIDNGYAQFTGKVADARGQTVEAIDQVARGRVWTGAQALEFGLVDELGWLADAVADAGERAGLEADGFRITYLEKEPTPFEQFVANMSSNAAARLLLAQIGLPAGLLPDSVVSQTLRDLAFLSAPAPAGPLPARVLAHCLCEI
jgi:protease-4